uniref:Uncharacterized protein n=1 Tax=Sphaerodactylus townsendi TaxID=933632 RepID=A0ACB8EML6_9SAUR
MSLNLPVGVPDFATTTSSLATCKLTPFWAAGRLAAGRPPYLDWECWACHPPSAPLSGYCGTLPSLAPEPMGLHAAPGPGTDGLAYSVLLQGGTVTNYPGNPALEPSFQATTNDSMFQIITVSKGTGLGLSIVGGINRDEGPLVYILEVIPGGDCHKDGRLRPGDQLVSINKESLIGVTHEEARDLLHSSKMRSDYSWEIAFVRQETVHSHVENMQPTFGLLPSVGCSQQRNPQTSRLPLTPDEHIAAKMSILSLKKAGFKERDKSSTVPANNTGDVTAGGLACWSVSETYRGLLNQMISNGGQVSVKDYFPTITNLPLEWMTSKIQPLFVHQVCQT